jgi:hypothetical protein
VVLRDSELSQCSLVKAKANMTKTRSKLLRVGRAKLKLDGAVFHVSMTAGMPNASLEVTLYIAPPGTRMPAAYGSGSSCVVM